MGNFNYDIIENSFVELLASVTTSFSEEELREIRELLENVEYGLALQIFVDIVIEEKKPVSHRTVSICENLVDLMKLTKEIDIQMIRDMTM